MANIFQRIKSMAIEQEKEEEAVKPKAIEVIKSNPDMPNEPQSETVIQKVGAVKTIKVNDPGKPVNGFTTKTLSDEMGLVISQAMHKAGLSSIQAEVFGVFNTLGLVPKYFDKIEDEFTGKEFYILKNSNRMTSLTRSIYKAIGNTNSDVISFPYIINTSIELPHEYSVERGDFIYNSVKVDSLYLTPKEIQNLNYQFISKINFCEKLPDDPESIDLISLNIDRAEWKAAPYRE